MDGVGGRVVVFSINNDIISILLGILDLRMPFFEEGFVGFAEISKGDAKSLRKIHHEWERGGREEGREREKKKIDFFWLCPQNQNKTKQIESLTKQNKLMFFLFKK